MSSKLVFRILSLFLTLLIVFAANLFSSVSLPWLGVTTLKFHFHLLVILFFLFYIKDDYISLYILIIEIVNSLFTSQGWEIGTLSGIMLVAISYIFKDLIQLSNVISTALYSFFFLTLRYFIFGFIYYTKIHSLDFLWSGLWYNILENIFLSILSPFVFVILRFIWKENKSESFSY